MPYFLHPLQVSCPLVLTEDTGGDFEKDVQDVIETWSVGGLACHKWQGKQGNIVSKVKK